MFNVHFVCEQYNFVYFYLKELTTYISIWTTIQHKVKQEKLFVKIFIVLKGCVELANSPKMFIYEEITGYGYCICSKSLRNFVTQ